MIVAFVVTDRYDPERAHSSNQVTFSEIMDIQQPDIIHFGLVGLCYASLDEIPEMHPDPAEGQPRPIVDNVSVLCPPESRLNPIHGQQRDPIEVPQRDNEDGQRRDPPRRQRNN